MRPQNYAGNDGARSRMPEEERARRHSAIRTTHCQP